IFSSRRRHTIAKRDWSSDVCSSDLSINCYLLFCFCCFFTVIQVYHLLANKSTLFLILFFVVFLSCCTFIISLVFFKCNTFLNSFFCGVSFLLYLYYNMSVFQMQYFFKFFFLWCFSLVMIKLPAVFRL